VNSPNYGWLHRLEFEEFARRKADQLRTQIADPDRQLARLRRSEQELLGEVYWPNRHFKLIEPSNPGPEVAFLTVANSRFYRGLEALLLSLVATYPDLSSPFIIVHDGTIGRFLQRRLISIYPSLDFFAPLPSWADSLPKDTSNRQRIGIMGYLNTFAFSLRGYRRVVVLDADLLVTGALDPLWAEGDAFRAVPDCGDRPWCPVSRYTRRPVLNSGVISIPGSSLTPESQHQIDALIRNAGQSVCCFLDRFADQKIWNLFLSDQPIELLPINLNCNVKYIVQYLGGCAEGLSVLHFAGPKPWLTWPWVDPDLDQRVSQAVTDHLLWNRYYRQQLITWRYNLFLKSFGLCGLLPTGSMFFAIHPDEFGCDHVQADQSRHLLLSDHGLWGQDWPDQCCWPDGWLQSLHKASPLMIWAPFEWEPALRDLPLPSGVDWHWLLIEAPFSPSLAEGADLIADDGEWHHGFEPWSDPLLPAMERAVRRQFPGGIEVSYGPLMRQHMS
jgi:lipopolysaccharide biosynthesis glycosyltransferase